jgi:hypothetical protein
MGNDKLQRAVRAARYVKVATGTVVGLLFPLWLAFGFLQGTAFEVVAYTIGLAWLIAFVSVPVLSFVWLARFGSLPSTRHELRLTTWLMVVLIMVWLLIVVGLFALLVLITRGLLNFI